MLGIMSEEHSRGGGHDHGHDHGHEHHPQPGLASRLRHVLRPHSHAPADQVDAVMEGSAEGMRTLWISLAILGVTAVIQAIVAAVSGPVALLGDTLHNAADALTAVPLGVAFVVGGTYSLIGRSAWPGRWHPVRDSGSRSCVIAGVGTGTRSRRPTTSRCSSLSGF